MYTKINMADYAEKAKAIAINNFRQHPENPFLPDIAVLTTKCTEDEAVFFLTGASPYAEISIKAHGTGFITSHRDTRHPEVAKTAEEALGEAFLEIRYQIGY